MWGASRKDATATSYKPPSSESSLGTSPRQQASAFFGFRRGVPDKPIEGQGAGVGTARPPHPVVVTSSAFRGVVNGGGKPIVISARQESLHYEKFVQSAPVERQVLNQAYVPFPGTENQTRPRQPDATPHFQPEKNGVPVNEPPAPQVPQPVPPPPPPKSAPASLEHEGLLEYLSDGEGGLPVPPPRQSSRVVAMKKNKGRSSSIGSQKSPPPSLPSSPPGAPSPIAQGYPSPTPPKLVAPPRRAVPPPSASGYIGNIAAGSPPPNSPPQYPMSTPPSSPPMLKIQLPPLELQDLDPDTPPTPPPKSASADSEDPILKKWMLDSDTVSQNMKDKKDWEGRLDGMLEEFRELAGGEAHAAILSTGGERIQEKNEGNSQTSTAATLTALSVPSFIGDQSFRKSSANLGRTPSLLSVSSVDLMARYGRMGDFDATPRTSRLPRTPSLLSVSSIDLMARYGRAGKNNNENRLTRGSVLSITPEELIRRYGRNGHPKSRPLPPLPRTPSRESLISLYSVTKGLSAGTSALKVANFWVPGETAEDSDSTTSKVSEQPESDNRQSHTDKTAEEKKERPVSSISLTPSEIIMKFTAALSDSGSSRTSPETEPTSSKPADSDTQSTTSQDIILSTILGTSSSMPVFSSFLLSIFDEVDKSDNTVELRKRVSFNAESLMESYGVSATEAVLAATAAVVAEAEAEVDGERGAKSEEGGSGISDQDEDADGSEPSPALNVLINDVDYMCDDYADDGPSTSEDSQSGVKTDVMRTGTNDDVADPPVGREDKATTTTAGGTDTDDSIDPASTSTLSEELPPLPSFRLGSLGDLSPLHSGE